MAGSNPPKSIQLSGHVSLDVAGQTDVGRERSRNEDQFLIATLQRNLKVESTSVDAATGWLPTSTEGTVILVADGMGGTAGGDVASSVAVRAIANYVCNVLPWADGRQRKASRSGNPRRMQRTLPGVRSGLSSALVQGDAEVKRAAAARGTKSMGTTLTLAYLQWPHLYVAHAGDSRCYLHHGGQLEQLTTDHTLAEKLREQSNLELDATSPWHHVLWNALGGGNQATLEPEVHKRELAYGDVLLLCSDGLTKHLNDEQIAAVLQASPSAHEASTALVSAALADGGTDNVTVVVARCRLKDHEVDSEAPTRARGRRITSHRPGDTPPPGRGDTHPGSDDPTLQRRRTGEPRDD